MHHRALIAAALPPARVDVRDPAPVALTPVAPTPASLRLSLMQRIERARDWARHHETRYDVFLRALHGEPFRALLSPGAAAAAAAPPRSLLLYAQTGPVELLEDALVALAWYVLEWTRPDEGVAAFLGRIVAHDPARPVLPAALYDAWARAFADDNHALWRVLYVAAAIEHGDQTVRVLDDDLPDLLELVVNDDAWIWTFATREVAGGSPELRKMLLSWRAQFEAVLGASSIFSTPLAIARDGTPTYGTPALARTPRAQLPDALTIELCVQPNGAVRRVSAPLPPHVRPLPGRDLFLFVHIAQAPARRSVWLWRGTDSQLSEIADAARQPDDREPCSIHVLLEQHEPPAGEFAASGVGRVRALWTGAALDAAFRSREAHPAVVVFVVRLPANADADAGAAFVRASERACHPIEREVFVPVFRSDLLRDRATPPALTFQPWRLMEATPDADFWHAPYGLRAGHVVTVRLVLRYDLAAGRRRVWLDGRRCAVLHAVSSLTLPMSFRVRLPARPIPLLLLGSGMTSDEPARAAVVWPHERTSLMFFNDWDVAQQRIVTPIEHAGNTPGVLRAAMRALQSPAPAPAPARAPARVPAPAPARVPGRGPGPGPASIAAGRGDRAARAAVPAAGEWVYDFAQHTAPLAGLACMACTLLDTQDAQDDGYPAELMAMRDFTEYRQQVAPERVPTDLELATESLVALDDPALQLTLRVRDPAQNFARQRIEYVRVVFSPYYRTVAGAGADDAEAGADDAEADAGWTALQSRSACFQICHAYDEFDRAVVRPLRVPERFSTDQFTFPRVFRCE